MLTSIATFVAHKDYASDVAFSPDGGLLATCSSWDRALKLWSVGKWDERAHLPAEGDKPGIRRVRFFPGGKLILAAGKGAIWLFDVGGVTSLYRFQVQLPWVFDAVALPDETQFLSYGYDGILRLWNIQEGEVAFQSKKYKGNGGPLDCSVDGRYCAFGTGTAVSLWDVAAMRELHVLRGHKREVKALRFSHDGKTLATGSLDRTIRCWDVGSGEVVGTIATEQKQQVWSLAYLSDTKLLASGTGDGSGSVGKIAVWDTASTEVCAETGLHGTPIAVAASRDGKLIAGAYGHGGQVKIWAR
jgi:WD40 repeat protein